METNTNPLQEIFDELFSLLESLETQSMAVVQFLKDQKIGNDKKLAPYLEQAGNASSVKWRAARVRMEYLLAPIEKKQEEAQNEKKQQENKEQQAKEQERQGLKKQEPETKQAKEQGPNIREKEARKSPSEKSSTETADRDHPSTTGEPAKPSKDTDSGRSNPNAKEKNKPESKRE